MQLIFIELLTTKFSLIILQMIKLKQLFKINTQINTYLQVQRSLKGRTAIFAPHATDTIEEYHVPPSNAVLQFLCCLWEETSAELTFQLSYTLFLVLDNTSSLLICSGGTSAKLLQQRFKEHKEFFKDNASTNLPSHHDKLT